MGARFPTPLRRFLSAGVMAAALSILSSTPAAQSGRIDLKALLDLYAAGKTDDAMATVARATTDSARDLRVQLVVYGQTWLHNGAADISSRLFAAAAFALDMEAIRAERGEWSPRNQRDCSGSCVLEWACIVLRARKASDESDRLWLLASVALAEGVRDWSFLQTPLAPALSRAPEGGHLTHAIARHPDEPRFRLARATAIASRFNIANELDVPKAGLSSGSAPLSQITVVQSQQPGLIEERRRAPLDYAMQQFARLIDDPAVGVEARIRLAYLHYRSEEYEQARRVAEAAVRTTSDADLRYLASFLAGQAAQASGDLAGAETLYTQALASRPRAQSASLALAALQMLRGAAAPAYDLFAAPRTSRMEDDDPWRLFFYGDYPKLAALVRELRARVKP
jgi:tetratricopeptide (TPR) repeat protein